MKNLQIFNLQLFTPPLKHIYKSCPNFLILFFFLLQGLFMMAQNSITDDFCGTPDPEDPDPPGVYSRSFDQNYFDNVEPVYFNIFFWGIADDDGNWEGNPMTLQKAENAVDYINEHFSPFNICFNLVGMDIINSSFHHQDRSFYTVRNFAVDSGYVKQNAFNVYVPYSFDGPTGVANYNRTKLGIISCCLIHPTLIHELGHNFNLVHTFGPGSQRPHPINCETVTRNINSDDYNALTRGDYLHDTNAVPNFFREQHNYVAYAVEDANIGFNWPTARDSIAFSPIGFNSFPDAVAIEQALIDYGFTTAEIEHLKHNPAVDNAYYDQATKTYTPDDRINDPNSPFFKDCKGTPYQMNTVDIRNFMAYTHSSSKELFTVGQGIRMRESIDYDEYNEFEEAMRQHPLDLYIRDHEHDIGQEPNIHTTVFWQSPDIWVRNQNDGFTNTTHQNPEYSPTSPNYVYVRVTNKSCVASTGSEELFLHWAKAGIGGGWPALWNGQISNPVLMGNLVYAQTIPVIEPGDSAILEFEWYPPNPDDYIGHSPNDDPWHFCLLSRIVTPNDPMAFPEGSGNMIYRNNNIASKNVTVVTNPEPGSLSPGGAVFIGNIIGNSPATFNFEFKTTDKDPSHIYKEAEVVLTLDENAWDRWVAGGKESNNIKVYDKGERQLIITDNDAWLNNMVYAAGEWDVMYVSFNFLTKEVTNKEFFEYLAVQHDAISEDIVGGETYHILRDITRPHFAAVADVTKDNENNTFQFYADDIGENATYNWYAPDGALIHTGEDLTVSGGFAGEYILEVIAKSDAHKDYYYYNIETQQQDDQILSMTPNPVNTNVSISYQVTNGASASLQLIKLFDTVSQSYTLNSSLNETTINVSGFPIGIYAVVLIVDGNPVHAKQLIIN